MRTHSGQTIRAAEKEFTNTYFGLLKGKALRFFERRWDETLEASVLGMIYTGYVDETGRNPVDPSEKSLSGSWDEPPPKVDVKEIRICTPLYI